MAQIEITRVLQETPAKIWSVLSDFGGIHRFHPRVESSPILNGIPKGLGAERRCTFYDGNAIEEAVSGYREGEWMEVTITKASLPLRDITAAFQISPTPEGFSKLSVELDYTPKYSVFGAVMNALLIRRNFKKVFEEVLDGLEFHAATGKVVGQAGIAAAREELRASA